MELILKKDVENLGFADDLVNVKNGYGRNFLIPNGHAVLATPSQKKMLAETLKQRAHIRSKRLLMPQKLKRLSFPALADFKIVVKTGEGDKLFGSVSNADLSEAFAKEGIELEKKFITIAGGIIKRTGQYEASVRFHRDVISTFTFDVVAQASK